MKKPLILALGLAAALGGSSLASPYFTLHQMRQAILAKDAEALGRYVDFPVLRENVKAQAMARLGQSMPADEGRGNPLAGLGRMLAGVVVGPVVDTLVSPIGLVALMSRSGAPEPSAVKAEPGERPARRPDFSLRYESWNRVSIYGAAHEDDGARFILTRQGPWSWKLSAIELPREVPGLPRP